MVRSVWPRGARAVMALAGVLALVAALALPAGAAANGAAGGNVPGNNGTVKIHQGGVDGDQSGGANDIDNDPHVCTFHLHFYFADAGQAGTWWIESWPPTGNGTVVLSGSYLTGANGEYRTPPSPGFYSLPNGHYKLFWEGRNSQNIKQKVFWVTCVTVTSSQTPSATQAEESQTPSATQAEESQTPSATQAEESQTPSATQAEESQTPSATQAEESQTPSATQAEESQTPVATATEQAESQAPGTTMAPTQAVGGITSGPQSTPPPTAADSGGGDANSALRIALFGLAMLLFAMAAIAPRLATKTRR